MKCIIPGTSVKVFGRAIHSLSKIGDELYVEPLEHGFTLRTVNSSRSAYACFVFAPEFFQHYDDGSGEINSNDSEEDSLRCKITMKSCLTVFRSLTTIEKTVERCKICLDMKECKLTFQLFCKHGIVKTHNLAFIECETLQAVFSKDMCSNILTAHARLLADVVGNFQTSQEEVTLIVNSEKIAFKNYVDDEPDPQKVMHTELNLDADEFDKCQIGTHTDVTFCLKELRAILAFAEANNLPVTINFDTAGKPIVFTISGEKGFEGNFVLATLADLPSANSQQRSVSQTPGTSKSRSGGGDTITEEPSHLINKSTNKNRPPTRVENGSGDGPSDKQIAATTTTNVDNDYQDMMDDDMDMALTAAVDVTMETTSRRPDLHKVVEEEKALSQTEIKDKENEGKKRVLDVTTGDLSDHSEAEEDDPNDTIPGTPPSKKFKSLFFGWSQSTTQTSEANKADQGMVLAEDSDDD